MSEQERSDYSLLRRDVINGGILGLVQIILSVALEVIPPWDIFANVVYLFILAYLDAATVLRPSEFRLKYPATLPVAILIVTLLLCVKLIPRLFNGI